MKYLLIAFSLLLSGLAIGQGFTTSKNALLNLNYVASTDILNKLDSYEPSTTREKESFEKSKDLMAALMKAYLVPFVYTELESSKGIKLEDKDALRDYLQYDKDGMPLFIIAKSAVKTITKKGYEGDYFFNFTLNIGINVIMKGLEGQIKPQVTFSIKVFDKEKQVVTKIEEKIKTKTAIKLREFPKSKFNKLDEYYISMLLEKLKPQIEETVKLAISKL